jgi:hypothetical protein
MSIEGRIAIDVSFSDSTTSSGVQSLKKISLVDTTAYTTGKVAIVTGTCNTSSDNVVSLSSPGYRDSSGQVVSFSNITRVAFHATRSTGLFAGIVNYGRSDGNVSVTNFEVPLGVTGFILRTTAGTASYTLVLYGT